jgi:hypothetical protein
MIIGTYLFCIRSKFVSEKYDYVLSAIDNILQIIEDSKDTFQILDGVLQIRATICTEQAAQKLEPIIQESDEIKKDADNNKIRIIAVDFDGVLNSYDSGWQGYDIIPDSPNEGAIQWLNELTWDGRLQVVIFSSRCADPSGIDAIRKWLLQHGMHLSALDRLKFTCKKPPAHLTIDDRCFRFTGQFPNISWILGFKPWRRLNKSTQHFVVGELLCVIGQQQPLTVIDEHENTGMVRLWQDHVGIVELPATVLESYRYVMGRMNKRVDVFDKKKICP